MHTLTGKRALVTGATGMMGSHLVRRLLRDGAEVLVFARPGSNTIRLNDVIDACKIVNGDLSDPISIAEAVGAAKPDFLFHFASTFFNPPTLSNQTHYAVNVLGTQALLESVRAFPDTRFVFAGSGSACAGGDGVKETDPPNPSTVFGATKACASVTGQSYARIFGLSFVEVRFFMPFGPWERPGRLLPYTILKALAGEDVDIGDGLQERDFVFIDDAIEATIRAAIADVAPGTVINIGGGKGRSIAHAAQMVLDLMGNPVALKIGARQTRADEIWKYSADISTAKSVLGWTSSTPFRDALRRTIEWYTDNQELARTLP